MRWYGARGEESINHTHLSLKLALDTPKNIPLKTDISSFSGADTRLSEEEGSGSNLESLTYCM